MPNLKEKKPDDAKLNTELLKAVQLSINFLKKEAKANDDQELQNILVNTEKHLFILDDKRAKKLT